MNTHLHGGRVGIQTGRNLQRKDFVFAFMFVRLHHNDHACCFVYCNIVFIVVSLYKIALKVEKKPLHASTTHATATPD